ncbi:MAG: ABC transporter ATP-binding protein/permease [Anaerolineae bacterium]|nr:ABC transporter ATP-binding protein/permease [Anaerolineae bacterium]
MLTGFRLSYVGALFTLAVATVAKTGSYLLLAYFVDTVLGGGEADSVDTFLLIALGFVILALLEGFFTFQSGKLAAQTGEGIARRLRNYLFDHEQRLTFTYHDKMQTGELIQRSTSDVDAVRRFYAEQALGVGRIITLFIINFTAVFLLNSTLAVLSVIVIPIMVGMSFVFFRRIAKVYEAFQEQDAVLSTALQENLSGVRVVKAFARQDYEMDKFDKENWKRFDLGRKMLRMMSYYWPVSDTMGFIQLLFGLTLGALLAIDGTISVGVYIAYAGMVTRIIWPMRELGRLIVQMSTGLVSMGRVTDIIREDREPLDTGLYLDTNLRGEIEFKHVSFGYDGEDDRILHDISFRVEAGQSIALLGSTGSGKTTLVNLLPRFYDYTSGSILVDGRELTEYSRRYLRDQIAKIEQEPFLFSRTIRENIAYGMKRDVSDEEVIAAARAAAVHDVIESFPKGYETLVGERGVTLSGGQKQRVALARTLLKNPSILVLDDTTSSVDTETEAEIRSALRRLMRNRTTFIIAHRIQSLMTADQILVMDKGRIVQRGTHDELMQEPGIYRQVYDVQARIEDELEKEVTGV